VNAETSSRPRPFRILIFAAAGAALVLAGFVGGFAVASSRSSPPPLPDLGPAPRYTLTNQLGQSVSSTRFAGKVRIVTFLFPYCTSYCPLITAHLIGFERLAAQSDLRDRVEVVAFNVAPGSVGPDQMREYLKQYGWDPSSPQWQFLTGTPAQIRHVVTDGYHIAYERVAEQGGDESEVMTSPDHAPELTVANPLAERVKADYDITHNDAIELVDGHGRLRKIYDDADEVSANQLFDDVSALVGR
jgi:cytochrome oxidase Cu insertion factor (SCO1/SenC/PrrC family)